MAQREAGSAIREGTPARPRELCKLRAASAASTRDRIHARDRKTHHRRKLTRPAGGRRHRGRPRHRHHQAAGGHRARHPRRGLRQHRLLPVGHHVRRRREGHPPLPRHPHRAAGRQEHLRGDLLAAHLRGAAHRETAQGLERPVHQVRDDPRRALPPLRRLPVHGPPHGHPLGHDQRHELLRARPDGDGGRLPPSRYRPPASSASCAPSPRRPTRRPSASRSSTPSRTWTTARTSCT